MIVELYSTPEERNRYFDYGADIPFNFGLVRALGNRYQAQRNVCDAICIRDVIKEEYDTLPKGKWANFVVSALQRKACPLSLVSALQRKACPLSYFTNVSDPSLLPAS